MPPAVVPASRAHTHRRVVVLQHELPVIYMLISCVHHTELEDRMTVWTHDLCACHAFGPHAHLVVRCGPELVARVY